MTDDYPEPPRTDWGGLALLSEADDPEDYRDIHGAVIDQENWDEIKHKILEEGTYAERPEIAPFDGAKYHAKDINVTFAWDADAAEWDALNTGTEDTPVPGTTHLESVSTEELVTDGRTVLKFVEGIDAGSDTNQIQFDGLSDGQSYGIFVSRYQGGDNLLMTFNENESTDHYAYWDESGTKITSDNIELVDCTFPRLSGWIEIGSRPDGQFYGFGNRLRLGRPENVDGFAQKGGAEEDELDSVELFVDNDAEFSPSDRVELFEVI